MDEALLRAKAVLRHLSLAKRRAISVEARAAAGAAIANAALSMPEFRNAERVGAYMALPDEAPMDEVARAVLRSGRELLLPRVEASALAFVIVRDLGALRVGHFGIREPAPAERAVPLAASDLLFVPGLAFDAIGGRLGRGAGFYDRSLPRGARSPRLFGVAFAIQLVEAVPRGEQDRCLDGVVTERGVLRAGDPPRDAS